MAGVANASRLPVTMSTGSRSPVIRVRESKALASPSHRRGRSAGPKGLTSTVFVSGLIRMSPAQSGNSAASRTAIVEPMDRPQIQIRESGIPRSSVRWRSPARASAAVVAALGLAGLLVP